MNCPNCTSHALRAVLTTQDIKMDLCDNCQGVWLNEGALPLLSKSPPVMARHLEIALRQRRPSTKLSPRTGEPMEEITIPSGIVLDHCPATGGLWFDQDELKALLKQEPIFQMAIDRSYSRPAQIAEGQEYEGYDDPRAGINLFWVAAFVSSFLVGPVAGAVSGAHFGVFWACAGVVIGFAIGSASHFLLYILIPWGCESICESIMAVATSDRWGCLTFLLQMFLCISLAGFGSWWAVRLLGELYP